MQAGDPFIVALEGPSDSGKSTLAIGLRDVLEAPVLLLPCYADLVTDREVLPPPRASDIDAQIQGLDFFLDLDHDRRDEASQAGSGAVVVADRCWLGLLAHAYAVERTGGPAAYDAARRRVQERANKLLQPQLVLFLAVGSDRRHPRVEHRDKDQWFTSDDLNEQINTFLAYEAPILAPSVMHTLDARPEAQAVCAAAVRTITARLEGAIA